MRIRELFLALSLMLVSAMAAASGGGGGGGQLDMSGVTSAVDASTIVAAISSIAAIKILPGVARWGYNKVIGWFN
ncbi:hypothetical protein [Vreelandella utahensis]|uniref:hypothetical protein n=1 Tax=Vreelandella halophila TaxID=86177 RepID=UPI00117A4DA9|nr:hypothetical protein [Halomonas utahensis]